MFVCRVTVQTKQINSDKSNAFNRSSGRSRRITRHLVHVNKRDREPSRIPMKKLVHSMSRNKTRRHKIKSFIRRLIPKSSALHNLLSTRYRKCLSQKLTNINMYVWQFRKARRARKMGKDKTRNRNAEPECGTGIRNRNAEPDSGIKRGIGGKTRN